MKKGQPSEYIPHVLLDSLPVKVSISSIQDQKKLLRYFFDNESKESDGLGSSLEVMMTVELVVNLHRVEPRQQSLFIDKMHFNQHFVFNYKYKDLPYNSLIAVTLWCANKAKDLLKPLGSTTVSLFDEQLRLRQGKLHLMIWPNAPADVSYFSMTPGLVADENIKQIEFSVKTAAAKASSSTTSSSTSNAKENYVQEILEISKFYSFQKIPCAFLEVEFPKFDVLVLFADAEYSDASSSTMQGGNAGAAPVATGTSASNLVASRQKEQKYYIQDVDFSEAVVTADFDYEFGKNDLIQEQLALLLREDENPQELKPSKQELSIMEASLKKPILGELKQDEKLLFYRFRYSLAQNSDALVKFLHSVNWDSERENREAMKMLRTWEKCNYGDALHLLSNAFCANDIYKQKIRKPMESVITIRNYACDQLEKETASTIASILLQLTQALRYEPFDVDKSALARLLVKKASEDTEIATLLYWYILVECDREMDAKEKLKLSSTNQQVQEWFNLVFEMMQNELEGKCPQNYAILQLQSDFRSSLRIMVQTLKGKDRKEQIEIIKKRLASDEFKRPHFKEHPFCLNPTQTIVESVHQQSTVFKSAMAPIKMTFISKAPGHKEAEGKLEMIYKSGDDLRQDQLIMQIFNLLDGILKGVGQDFRLMPYKVLACSKSDGFMEFVPNSTTIQDLRGKGFANYLKSLVANAENPVYDEFREKGLPKSEIDELARLQSADHLNSKIIENYMLSCAGYSVMTYFLGVGDRHLENIMVDITGKFFHIDFGYILGQDPKPYPPPIKLCKQMIEGMGGKDSKVYSDFRMKCVHAYIYLRKYAKLIVNIFSLMIDSGIKDMSYEALEKLSDKFYLDLNDTQAELHFLNILDESETALFARVTDIIHKWASYWRA